uniref:Uncharacterized protein n=1 Tax=Rhizophora mucronata TaxID=61149 RepID=A0A2P2PMY5_RHIMU
MDFHIISCLSFGSTTISNNMFFVIF